jgi:hypothetical protein
MWDILLYLAIGFGGFVAGIIFFIAVFNLMFFTGRGGNILPW